MQTYLEKHGIESRNANRIRNDYTQADEYKDTHKDALSDGEALGKGNGKGGHLHSVPNQSKPRAIDYAAFNTGEAGGKYDVESRNFLKTISLYNEQNQYGAHLIDTRANKVDGQIII